MPEIASTITSKGQVTIPVVVRRHLGVAEHDKIIFVLRPDGSVELKSPRYPNVASLAGAAGSLGRVLSAKEMIEIAHDERAADLANRKLGD